MLDQVRDTNASVWISACAGTGKTKNLIDRILALLLRGNTPSKILCLTYTKAAAAEMHQRLSEYLRELHFASDEQLAAQLQNLGFNDASATTAKSLYTQSFQKEWVMIDTIHGFCLNILRKFPLEAGIMPDARLCSTHQKSLFFSQSINNVIANPKYSTYCKIISKYDLNIEELIENDLIKFEHFFDKFSNLQAVYSQLFDIQETAIRSMDTDNFHTIMIQQIFGDNYKELFIQLAHTLIQGSTSDQDKAKLLMYSIENNSDEFIGAFITQTGEIKKSLCTKAIASPDFYKQMQDTAQRCLSFLQLKNKCIAYQVNVAFFSIAQQVIHEFRQLKFENRCLDFDDVILMTISILHDIRWIMYKTDGNIDHLLIDEAQDTSPEQWEIIKMITDEFFSHMHSSKTVFIVGDEKQSIYSFQGADVELFGKMQEYFQKKSEGCGQRFFNIDLTQSYRSSATVLSFVDEIFANTFVGVKHSTVRNHDQGVVEILNVFVDDLETDQTDEIEHLSEATSVKRLAENIADFIKNSIDKKVYVPSKKRAALPSDFYILFQRRDLNLMKNIMSALKSRDIQSSGIDVVQLKEELIIEDLISFAEFSIFPLDDLMCARALKTPIIGVTESDLMKMCLARGNEHLWNHLNSHKQFADQYNINRIKQYMNLAFCVSPLEFFMKILSDGNRERFISRFADQCTDALNAFFNVIEEYEQDNVRTLSGFLKWFRSFDCGIKREIHAQDNTVKLMTAHGSKGLQAPFVILADTHFTKNRSKKIHALSNGVMIYDFSEKCRVDLIKNLHVKYSNLCRNESKRLLYVAMTRAEDFLYIVAKKHKKDLPENCWYNFITSNCSMEPTSSGYKIGEYAVSSEEVGVKTKPEIRQDATVLYSEIPSWAIEKLDMPTIAQTKQYTNYDIIYGECVHLLLSKFHYIGRDNMDDLIANFTMLHDDKDKIKKEVKHIIKTYPFIFCDNTKSEVSIIFKGKELRIDKIIYQNNEILIVDFKTGEPKKPIPFQYVEQIRQYKEALSCMHPESRIKTAILWTKTANLVYL